MLHSVFRKQKLWKPYHTSFAVNVIAGLLGCSIGDVISYQLGFLNPPGILLGLLAAMTWAYWSGYVPARRRWEQEEG